MLFGYILILGFSLHTIFVFPDCSLFFYLFSRFLRWFQVESWPEVQIWIIVRFRVFLDLLHRAVVGANILCFETLLRTYNLGLLSCEVVFFMYHWSGILDPNPWILTLSQPCLRESSFRNLQRRSLGICGPISWHKVQLGHRFRICEIWGLLINP